MHNKCFQVLKKRSLLNTALQEANINWQQLKYVLRAERSVTLIPSQLVDIHLEQDDSQMLTEIYHNYTTTFLSLVHLQIVTAEKGVTKL
jgi:hypothetical protein